MPLLHIQASGSALSEDARHALLAALSAEVARELGKPEPYVMVLFQGGAQLLFGGSPKPACFAQLKNVGTFTPDQTRRLSRILTERLAQALGVAQNRIYIEFVNAQGHLWGYDGDTFA